MADWCTERLQINSRVRAVLVSHLVDLGRMSFHAYPKKLILRGSLIRLPGRCGSTFSSEEVTQLLVDLGRVPKVKRVQPDLDNWRQEIDSGQWVEGDNNTSEREHEVAASHRGGFGTGPLR